MNVLFHSIKLKESQILNEKNYIFRRRSSIGTFIRPHSSEGTHSNKPNKAPPPKLDYRSMVSIDDMPELFVSFDSEYIFVFYFIHVFNCFDPVGIMFSDRRICSTALTLT